MKLRNGKISTYKEKKFSKKFINNLKKTDNKLYQFIRTVEKITSKQIL